VLGAVPGRPAQMRKDLGAHGEIFDGGDDRQGAHHTGAVFQVDIEHPFEQPGAANAGGGASRDITIWVVPS
jgi:hypothetical protein